MRYAVWLPLIVTLIGCPSEESSSAPAGGVVDTVGPGSDAAGSDATTTGDTLGDADEPPTDVGDPADDTGGAGVPDAPVPDTSALVDVGKPDTGTPDTLPAPDLGPPPDAGPTSCANPGDCAAAGAQAICDPETLLCADGACATAEDCGEGKQCILQGVTAAFQPISACYRTCATATPETCGEGRICATNSVTGQAGICMLPGDAVEGAPCALSAVSTGCAAGLGCSAGAQIGETVCRKVCDPFAGLPGCAAGEACVPGATCIPDTLGDPAAVGQPCASGALALTACGSDGMGYRGMCVQDVGGTLCRAICRPGGADCAGGEVCTEGFSEPVPNLVVDVGVCVQGT